MTVQIQEYTPLEAPRDWGVEKLVAEGPGCVGKVLTYRAGYAGGLQLHTIRWEAFFLFSGEAWVDSADGQGDLIRQKMTPGMSFLIPPLAAHRFTAITDCTVFEVSTSAAENRVRLEMQYGEPETGGLPTTEPQA